MNKRIRKITIILIILIIVISTFTNIWADTEHKVYKFGVWNNANTAIIGENGKVSGFEPDLFKEIANYLPYETEILVFDNKLEALEALNNYEVDAIMSSLFTDDIAQKYEYSEIMVRHVDAVLVNYQSDYTYQEYELMEGKQIGYLDRGDTIKPILEYLGEKIVNPVFIAFNTVQEIRDALYNREIDLGTFGIGALKDDLTVLDRFYALPTYYITRKNESSIINNALSQFLSSSSVEYSSLYYEYYPRAITTELSRDEIEYINSDPKIKACTIRDKNVFSSLSNTGEIIGIFPDIIKSINEISGLNIQMLVTPKNKTLQSIVENNECQVAIGLDSIRIVGDDNNYIFCNSIMKIPMELIVNKGDILLKGETNRVVLTREGCLSDVFVKEYYPNWIIKYEPNIEERYDMLLKGDVDCLIDTSYSFNYLSSKEKNKNLTRYPTSLFDSNINIIVQKDNEILANIINKSLVRLKKENLNNIIEYNISNITYNITMFDIFLAHRLEYLGIFIVILVFFFIIYYLANKRKREELEKTNQDLINAEQSAIEANQAKSIFLARMSHDMRTPLGAVIALSNFGINEEKDENLKSYFIDINDSSTYLLSLIDDILDSQKLQSNCFEFNYSIVDYCKVVKRIITVIENKIEEKDIDFNITNKCRDVVTRIFADEKRISQIYVNILNNAIKYTPKGGSIYWDNWYELVANNKIRIISTIRDTGVGMSQEFIKNKLYSPFSKEVNTLSKDEGGSGLGLNISKNLIDQMNGEINCESVLGEGTTFTISIEYKLVNNHVQNDRTIDINNSDDSVFIDKKMLVCDDTEINLKIAKKILEKKMINVDIAYNGEDAVNKVMSNKYDAILMDIRMPILDGIEATKRIRKFDKKTPIIAFSANAYAEDEEKSLKAGMNNHLAKPIDTKKLFNILYSYFSENES
ncbi:MAG: response regulator [Pleomorphochaeta sp.]